MFLKWAAIFFVIAMVAAAFGFTGVAEGAADVAKILLGHPVVEIGSAPGAVSEPLSDLIAATTSTAGSYPRARGGVISSLAFAVLRY
jgi:uncharacterized membrane protein YtjA (UPF0391 family)